MGDWIQQAQPCEAFDQVRDSVSTPVTLADSASRKKLTFFVGFLLCVYVYISFCSQRVMCDMLSTLYITC